MNGRLTTAERQTLQRALQKAETEVNRGWGGAYGVVFSTVEDILRARIAELEAQVAGLERMNTEKAAEIRRLRMGNHPAGRALHTADYDVAALDLRQALEHRDAGHDGGEGA